MQPNPLNQVIQNLLQFGDQLVYIMWYVKFYTFLHFQSWILFGLPLSKIREDFWWSCKFSKEIRNHIILDQDAIFSFLGVSMED